jgi:hypothetical protein
MQDETVMEINNLSEASMQNDLQNPWLNPPQYDPFPRSGILLDGEKFYSQEEINEFYRKRAASVAAYRQSLREEWLATPQGKLCLAFYQKFQEYKEYLEKNPLPPYDPALQFPEHKLFAEGLHLAQEWERDRAEKDRANLRRARQAARCEHRHADGKRCGSPRMRGKKLCYKHDRMEEARATKLDLGLMEDAESIQLAIMRLQRAVIDGLIDDRQSGRLAYLIQLAAWNATHTRSAGPEYNGPECNGEDTGVDDQERQ